MGADLSGVFTTDYEGETRTVPWDIGADGFGLTGGGGIMRSGILESKIIQSFMAG